MSYNYASDTPFLIAKLRKEVQTNMNC